MLTPLKRAQFAQYAEFAYQLSLDPARSCYPAYFDGVKTRDDFLRAAREALESETAQILLFTQNGRVQGWLQYFWTADERYLQLTVCSVAAGTAAALAEFLLYARRRFAGFSCVCGFAEENTQALAALQEAGFSCIERLCNNACVLARLPERFPCPPLVRVTRENFDRFRALHAPAEGELYWTSDRILQTLERWQILLLEDGGADVGAVYMAAEESVWELYGAEAVPGAPDAVYAALLAGALRHAKRQGARYVTYLCEPAREAQAQAAGFTRVGGYVCLEGRV